MLSHFFLLLLQLFLAKYFLEVGACTMLGPMNIWHCLSKLCSAFWISPISRAYCMLLDKHSPSHCDSHSRGLSLAPTHDSWTSPWSLSLRSASEENKVYYFRVCFVSLWILNAAGRYINPNPFCLHRPQGFNRPVFCTAASWAFLLSSSLLFPHLWFYFQKSLPLFFRGRKLTPSSSTGNTKLQWYEFLYWILPLFSPCLEWQVQKGSEVQGKLGSLEANVPTVVQALQLRSALQ